MKTKIICVLCCTVVAFLAATACGTSDGSTEKASSSNDVSSNETISVIDSELDNKLLENEKNVAGNGYIIINAVKVQHFIQSFGQALILILMYMMEAILSVQMILKRI